MNNTLAWLLFAAMQLSSISQLWYAMLAFPEYFEHRNKKAGKNERVKHG